MEDQALIPEVVSAAERPRRTWLSIAAVALSLVAVITTTTFAVITLQVRHETKSERRDVQVIGESAAADITKQHDNLTTDIQTAAASFQSLNGAQSVIQLNSELQKVQSDLEDLQYALYGNSSIQGDSIDISRLNSKINDLSFRVDCLNSAVGSSSSSYYSSC